MTSQVKSRADLNMPYPSADEPGASYMKRSEMLIISLSGLNQRFQSHVYSCLSIVQGALDEDDEMIILKER